MRTGIVLSLGCLATLVCGLSARAQSANTEYVTDPDGTKYQVTRRVTPRSIATTELKTQEQKVLRPQVTTDYQTYQQMYMTPVTEYRMVSRMHGWWNPFAQPYWTHNVEPVTRWEARPGTVQIPTARTDWVTETRTAQVPVTTFHVANEEVIVRTPVSAPPSSSLGTSAPTAIASRPPAQTQLYQTDPPRQASPWANPQYGTGTVR